MLCCAFVDSYEYRSTCKAEFSACRSYVVSLMQYSYGEMCHCYQHAFEAVVVVKLIINELLEFRI